MRALSKTLITAVASFAVGAGAVSGGVYTYSQLNPSVLASGSGTKASQYATVASSSPTLPLGPDSVSNVVKRASPAIVKIVASSPQRSSSSGSLPFSSLFGGYGIPQQSQTDIGTGFFFNSKGYILTNDHVIHGQSRIQVYVKGYSKPFTATRVGTDYNTDLAVIKISPPKPMPTLPLGNSNATQVGSWAIAIGNPYNLSDTVTVGVISAKGRPLSIGQRHYTNLLQTSAAINPGNSGGPLLNLAGQVVGINTAVSTQGQGIGFAIPTSTVDQIMPQLMKYGHVSRPWIGVFITTDSRQLAKAYSLPTSKGVVIAYVVPHSPARRAGLAAGEVITAVNGKSVTSDTQLIHLIQQHKVGSSVTLSVNDQGHQIQKTVTLAQEPNGPVATPSSGG